MRPQTLILKIEGLYWYKIVAETVLKNKDLNYQYQC